MPFTDHIFFHVGSKFSLVLQIFSFFRSLERSLFLALAPRVGTRAWPRPQFSPGAQTAAAAEAWGWVWTQACCQLSSTCYLD